MDVICFDIESASDDELVAAQLAHPPTFEAPSNYRDEAKIEAYIARSAAEWEAKVRDKAALSPLSGRIVAITLCYEGTPRTHVSLDDERRLLGEFAEGVVGSRLVGFNSESFDAPFLRWRYLRHNLPIPPELRHQKPWESRPRYDLRLALNDGDKRAPGTLDRIADFMRLDVPEPVLHPDTGLPLTGADVASLVDGGHVEVLRRYCERDGLLTWQLFSRCVELGVEGAL